MVRSHIGWGGERIIFYKGVKAPLPSRRVLRILMGSPKGKVQRGQYLLAVELDCYKWYQSQTPGNVLENWLSPKGE